VYHQLVLILSLTALTIASCDKRDIENEGVAHLNMYLTDAPAGYDEVNINIQAVEIHTDAGGWKTYNLINPGIYNLLNFNSGVDTLMISEDMSPATVSQIRLILGDGNHVVVDGVTYPMETPSAEESGLKLNVHYEFEAGIVYELWLDFDAGQSIVEQGSGDYLLKPVIHVYTQAESGAIEGDISPLGAATYVMAISGADSMGTFINADGTFLIGGLAAGTYDVEFTPAAGFLGITVPSVNVEIGAVTDIGTVLIPL
jgi:hypothetical protein